MHTRQNNILHGNNKGPSGAKAVLPKLTLTALSCPVKVSSLERLVLTFSPVMALQALLDMWTMRNEASVTHVEETSVRLSRSYFRKPGVACGLANRISVNRASHVG